MPPHSDRTGPIAPSTVVSQGKNAKLSQATDRAPFEAFERTGGRYIQTRGQASLRAERREHGGSEVQRPD